MKRLSNWAGEFDKFIRLNSKQPFSYGSWDCALFVAGAVSAMTGTDLADSIRGRYQSRETALDLAEARTGVRSIESLVEQITRDHGMTEVPVRMAQRGDIVLAESPFELGIVALNGMQFLAPADQNGTDAIVALPINKAVRAWRVG